MLATWSVDTVHGIPTHASIQKANGRLWPFVFQSHPTLLDPTQNVTSGKQALTFHAFLKTRNRKMFKVINLL